ncbi:MAG: 23S rRNA (adenine(2503)-C(2))-methyltransferase RlmN [Chloroflexi bacterium]|nr:23S rRNA (adenine(2503)-C(2))-methyltransferase RlmN [Chloroflexota bacterium]
MPKQNIYQLDERELIDQVAQWGFTREAGAAIWRCLHRDAPGSIQQVLGVPAALVQRLDEAYEITPVVADGQIGASHEGVLKYLLRLTDGVQIETVLLWYGRRRSGCISTQVGCACGCPFCATGQTGYVRDLTRGEIVGQVMFLQRELHAVGEALTNVVLMGMGEPLLNYTNTIGAIRRIVDRRGLALAERRVTLSTVGVVPGIDRLAREPLSVKLAVSLHAASDELRDRLVPLNRKYPLDALFRSIGDYVALTGRRVLLEWVMIDGVNDTREQAEELAYRAQGLHVHLNAIRLNETPGNKWRPSSVERIDAFTAILDEYGVPHTLRQSRGASVAAGCGQLRGSRQGVRTTPDQSAFAGSRASEDPVLDEGRVSLDVPSGTAGEAHVEDPQI